MIEQKAIKELQAQLNYPGFQCSVEANKEAIKSLEKQVPQRPYLSYCPDFYTHKCLYKCPTCKEIIYYSSEKQLHLEHCNNCGQALDWSACDKGIIIRDEEESKLQKKMKELISADIGKFNYLYCDKSGNCSNSED